MILAIFGALFIGLCLGLLGSGGAIITVPVLVYLVHHPEKQAIAESLAIVCVIAATGALHNGIKRAIHWQSVGYFAPPSMLGAFVGAWLSHPVSGHILLAVLAVVMLGAATMMLKGPDLERERPRKTRSSWKIMLDGFAVGLMIGFVGIGGGFLIVPALVILGGMPMRLAVGTTLAITALSSAVSFIKHWFDLAGTDIAIDWNVIALFAGVGVLGRWAGHHLGSLVPHHLAARTFSIFLVVVAIFIIVKELLFLAS